MKLSYKYRIYPTSIQREALDKILYLCRYLYNSALQERISYYKKYNKTLSYIDQASELKEINVLFPEFENVYSQTRQQVLKTLDSSFKNFFRRLKAGAKPGFPRFKNPERLRSFCFPQITKDLLGGGVKLLLNNKIKIFGIPGEVDVWWHRPFQGRCKQARIKKEADKYYLVLSCDEVPKAPLPKTGREIGIDLGISSFITGDDGLKIHHPKPLKRAKDKLLKAQRNLAYKKRGSNNRARAKLRLARCYEKISNIRKDFLHKVALQLVQAYDTVVLEKLNIKEMLQSNISQLNQSISDTSWGILMQYISYKAERADKKIIFIDPKNTSKTCSGCNNLNKDLTLQDRTYHCQACGLTMDRDLNAAINIKRLGMSLAAHSE